MRDMMNVAFQNAWFGPYAVEGIRGPMQTGKRVSESEDEDLAWNNGPLDGPLSVSSWAFHFGGMPLARQRPTMGAPVFCRPGFMPVQTGIPGQSKCVPYEPPSTMIGPQPMVTVSTMVPPAWPTARTFPVRPFWGWTKD